MSDEKVNLPGYQQIRLDRNFILSNKSRGGGLIIYIKNNIHVQFLYTNNYFIEYIIIKVTVNNKHILLCLVYVPPDSLAQYEVLFDKTNKFIQTMINACSEINVNDSIILLGDFNLSGFK